MLKNYLKTAFRSLVRNKLYSTINIAGLTFGLSCFLLIGLYLFDELTYDQQHSKGDRIYRVIERKTVNGESTIIAGGGYKLAEESKRSIPAVESTTRVQRTGRANILNPENPSNFFQETVTVADESFFRIFDFPFLAGDKKTALQAPNSIVITQDLAEKLFASTDVLGKTLQFSFMESPMKITGILLNLPKNSSFDFNSVMSEASFQNADYFKASVANDWLSENFSVYVLLKPNTQVKMVAKQLVKLVQDNFTPPAGTRFSFDLQPLTDIHLRSEHIVDGARNSNVNPVAKGSMSYIKIFSVVAFFLLLIAGINYMNLTTARASGRLKEIGVRKTIGALEGNLMRQFLLESLLVTFISFLLSVVVVNVLLPAFNSFTNKELSFGFFTDYRIWIYAIGFAAVAGILSGSYPALMLSRFKPFLLLRGGLKPQRKTGFSLRKGLVVFQFTVSIVLIIATLVLFMQVKYLNNTDLGFNKNLLVVVDVNTRKARSAFEAVKSEMAKIPTVKNVSVTSRVPGEWKSIVTIKIKNNGSTKDPNVSYLIGADKDFLKTYEIKLLQGRNFDTPADSTAVIINETAAKMLGITQASGQTLEIPSFSWNGDGTFVPVNDDNTPFKPNIIGIVKDFHFQSLRNKIEPLVLAYHHYPFHVIDYYSVRIAATGIRGTLDKLKQVMVNNDKEDPFEYHFLNDQLALFYIEDDRRQTILIWAALATIFIACLGLFGLATYSADQRIKEIGIRKVLGATDFQLASLLSKDFLKLVLIANGIAFPLAWLAADKWLQDYAYHINVQWWVFAVSGIVAMLIAVVTISFQAVKAAVANPVNSLRTQ
jgi:putative ABC transport system permease protein